MKSSTICRRLARICSALAVLSAVGLLADEWTLSQFPPLSPIITFETTGTTELPGIPGISLSGGITASANTNYNPSNIPIGYNYFGDLAGWAPGFSYLEMIFDQPQQAVGAYLINADPSHNVTGVMEVVYDADNVELESASRLYPRSGQPPVFLGIGEATTNIYRVEWRYTGAPGFFGVDNIIYSPGPVIVLTNLQSSITSVTIGFQTLPGHTNTIQSCSDLANQTWADVWSVLGDGANKQVLVSTTNSPTGFFRVRVQ